MRVLVYCASSQQAHPEYRDAAARLGDVLARASCSIVYGGGASGSMGALADAALAVGGEVMGIQPRFMRDLEWTHTNLTSLEIVEDMQDRKRRMLESADALVALPGGSGTFDEIFDAITAKRLGRYLNPIILVNQRCFFDPCIELLERCIDERFMHDRHREMWRVVDRPEEVMNAIETSPEWSAEAVEFAGL